MHSENAFVTLTYSDEYLPKDYGVHIEHLQKFFKRLRKQLGEQRIRYVACGEYGDENLRPHYHFVLFGHDFSDDRKVWRKSTRGDILFRSDSLEQLWPYGHSEIGAVTKESGDYVARYVLKKIGGQMAAEHYLRLHPITQTMHEVSPEFFVMSSRPGIGRNWFAKFESDVFPADFIVVNGMRMPTPRYFTRQLEGRDENEKRLLKIDDSALFKSRRKKTARELAANSTPERLEVREKVREARIQNLKRSL